MRFYNTVRGFDLKAACRLLLCIRETKTTPGMLDASSANHLLSPDCTHMPRSTHVMRRVPQEWSTVMPNSTLISETVLIKHVFQSWDTLLTYIIRNTLAWRWSKGNKNVFPQKSQFIALGKETVLPWHSMQEDWTCLLFPELHFWEERIHVLDLHVTVM